MVTLDAVVETLSKLHMLKDYISALYKDIDEIILSPRLNIKDRRAVSALHVQQNEITMIGQLADLSIKKLFADMKLTVEFFHDHLPSSISNPLVELLIPGLVSRLISDWLSISLPIDTKGIPGFEEVLVLVVDFGDTLELYGWPGKGELIAWVNKIPQIWIDNRREISLDQIRKLLAGGLGKSETVERIETQVLSRGDEWNASWSDNERDDNSENLTLPDARDLQSKDQEEDDVSAWGLDSDDNDESLKESLEGLDVEHEDADAWGWGDETENIETSHPIEATNTKINGRPEASDQAARKITLKETYNITTLPKAIFEIITQIISDAETLKSPG